MTQMLNRIVAAMRWLTEVWVQKRCLIVGHDGTQETNQGEVFARCQRCLRRSPGWQLPATRPVLKFDGDKARHMMAGRLADWKVPVESCFGIPAGDPSPFLEPFVNAMILGEDELRLFLTRTDGRVH